VAGVTDRLMAYKYRRRLETGAAFLLIIYGSQFWQAAACQNCEPYLKHFNAIRSTYNN
jgi:hypothetical protein